VPEKLETAMSKFPQAGKAKTFTPAWMKTARAWYGSAFEPKKKGDLAESMSDWSEMDPAERGFVLAHLQYLGLQAELGTQRMLRELRALFEEVGDEVLEALEGVADAVEPEDEGEADADADGAEVVTDDGAEPEPEERRLELVEDTPILDYEPEPRVMPVEAVAPEMLRGDEEENVIDLPGPAADDLAGEPPEGA